MSPCGCSRKENPDLAARAAYYFLQIWEPEPNESCGPPGIGPSWLFLAREGVDVPVDPAGLAALALQIPEDFFQGIAEDDLIPLCRLIVESKKPLDVWVLHALLTAVTRARIPGRAVFHVFEDLMEFEDSARTEAGALSGYPRAPRRSQSDLRACEDAPCFPTTDDALTRIPRIFLEIETGGVGARHPGLKRHAVRALVETLGDPLEDVIAEFFLQDHGDQESTVAVTEGALDLMRPARR